MRGSAARGWRLPLLLQSHCRRHSTAAEGHWPVAIVGGGPTGLTLAALLSKYGVPSLLLERSPAFTTHPQAHFINNRTMEIFRTLPGGLGPAPAAGVGRPAPADSLAARVAAASPPLAQWRSFVYCESLTGRVFGEVDHFKGQASPQREDLSPEGVAHLSQSRLLPLLAAAGAAGCAPPALRMGHALRSFRQAGDHVELHVDSPETSYAASARFLVAADGAGSRVRGALGVALAGEPALQRLVNIHFWAPALARQLRGSRPAMLYFVFNPEAVVVIVAHDLEAGEFVAQVPFFPPVQRLEQFDDAACRRLLLAAAGLADTHVVIKGVRSWTMSAQVARTFQAGRVFLAGDAAHRFPPAGGFGMNTGIQDAHNLAWKLAHALGGARLNAAAPDPPRAFAGARLLASYTAERRPVAQANTELSVANFWEAMRVPQALGLDPRAAQLLAGAATAAHAALPELGRRLLGAGMALGLAAGGACGPLAPWRERRLQQVFGSGASLRLQFPREDLGFVYAGAGCAALPDSRLCASEWGASPDAEEAGASGAQQPAAAAAAAAGGRDAPYEPSTLPGARLPHVRLRPMFAPPPWPSLLDLTGDQWALVLSGMGAARVWSAAAAALRATGFPLRVVHVVRSPGAGAALCHLLKKRPAGRPGAGACSSSAERRRLTRRGRAVRRARKRTDVQVAWVRGDVWEALRGVPKDGAILVRPDGHVAWRCLNGPPLESGAPGVAAAGAQLQAALEALVAWPGLFAELLQPGPDAAAPVAG